MSEAIRDGNGDYIPDRLGETVTLIGILTTDPRSVPRGAVANLQDASGGILLHTRHRAVLDGRFRRGDRLKVQGEIGLYRGMEELLVAQIERLGWVEMPGPRDVLAADLHGERYSGQLVRVVGQLVVRQDFVEKKAGVVVQDRSGEIPVYIRSEFLEDPEFTRRLVRGGQVEVVGIARQYKREPPFNSGYHLLPRDPADFRFPPLPPYRAIVLGMALLILCGTIVYLSRRRRMAEQCAREMAGLLESLKRSERALADSEERYRELFENANDIVYTQALTGDFTSFNKAGERVTGYSRDEAFRMHMSQLLAPEYVQLARQELHRQSAGEGPGTYELEIVAKSGRRVALELSSRLICHHGEAAGFQGIARDVTERKQLEAQLRQSQKMEAVGRLAGGIAHDFNNMLTVIKGYSDLLLEQLGSFQERERRAATEINQAADRAASLTRQLLAYSRRQILEPKVLDLNEVISNMEGMLRRLIGEDIELVAFLNSGLGPVRADPGQIEQVIMNLAVNARDAMPWGGKLKLETDNLELERSHVRDGATVPPGSYVALSVSDTGCGIDAETRLHIFEPFFTTKEQGKGTGLGLATVYGIVKQSGGYIWVDSELGRGATFKIYLPCIEATVATIRPARPLV